VQSQDVAHDLIDTLRRIDERLMVELLFTELVGWYTAAIVHLNKIIRLYQVTVFHRKTQHIAVTDRIGDHITVQRFTEEVTGRLVAVLSLHRVGIKDRCAGKAEHLSMAEEVTDTVMGITELATVALIKNEHHFLAGHILTLFFELRLGNGRIQLLDGGDDEFAGAVIQLLNQLLGVLRGIHAVRTEGVEFQCGLVVQIPTVNNKQHLVDLRVMAENLACLERGQRFTRPCGVPDVAIPTAIADPFQNPLHGVILVGSENHQVP